MIKIVPTVSPTSVLEQARIIAERINGEVIASAVPMHVDVLFVFGPPNQIADMASRMIRRKYTICYWVVEGILTAYGRRVARTLGCDLSVAISKAVKIWMEESDVYVDYIIPHEIIPADIYAKPQKQMAVYIAGNYPRKWTSWALQTLGFAKVIDAYYREEIPPQYSAPFNAVLEKAGVKKLEKMDKQKLYELIAQYPAFASLSASEGFGLFQREAMHIGLNLVAIKHDAFWDIQNHPCFYGVDIQSTVYVKSNRNDVYEEFNMWNPDAYVEQLYKALERPCTQPLRYQPHYNTLKRLISELVSI